jgi:hypothetical protein
MNSLREGEAGRGRQAREGREGKGKGYEYGSSIIIIVPHALVHSHNIYVLQIYTLLFFILRRSLGLSYALLSTYRVVRDCF